MPAKMTEPLEADPHDLKGFRPQMEGPRRDNDKVAGRPRARNFLNARGSPRDPDELRWAPRFTLKTVFLAVGVIAVGIMLWTHPTGNGHLLAFPLAAAALFVGGVFKRNRAWRHALLSWGAIAGIVALVDIELASGYGADVPFLGNLPALSPTFRSLVAGGVAACVVLGLWQATAGLRSQLIGQKAACTAAGLLLAAMAIFFMSRWL